MLSRVRDGILNRFPKSPSGEEVYPVEKASILGVERDILYAHGDDHRVQAQVIL